jgi:hypothetical protein
MSIFTPRPTGIRLVAGTGPETIPRTEPCDPLPGLWDFAGMVHEEICMLFGEPGELATKGYINRRSHRILGDWLRNLELLVRRLLLIAALAFDPGALCSHGAKPQRERGTRLVWSDRPEGWVARFRVFPKKQSRRHIRKERDPDKRVPQFPNPWPMARRIEALRRVLANPDRRAHRLALHLARIRLANAKANAPRIFSLRRWDFSPAKRTSGKFAVNEAMQVAQPIAEQVLARWQEPG